MAEDKRTTGTRVQVFLGKGGVGKTTCSAATALSLAESGQCSLLLSTDPTPSLSHIFEIDGVHRDREVLPSLFLTEFGLDDVRTLWDEKFGREVYGVFSSFVDIDYPTFVMFMTSVLPGLNEEFMVDYIRRLAMEARYRNLVWDTAPLGQTLALLGMPEMLGEHLRIAPRIYSRLRTPGDRKESVLAILERWRALAAECYDFLRRDVVFSMVTIPEALSVCQLDGVVKELDRYGLAIGRLIVNNVVQESDSPFLTQKMLQQRPHLQRLHESYGSVPIVEIPLFSQEVRGMDRLRDVGRYLCPALSQADPQGRGELTMQSASKRNQSDLLLLHAPSVYDFRERSILYGPVSDMVPSSVVFEMYPLGFLTMASYLHDRGLDVRIVNLALRMMNDRRFDVPRFIGGLRPRAIGIDLHWLPHAHGALEVAAICKQVHPDVPVIMGGLSASYFHEELVRYPQVDFVLRGDSTEPPLHELLVALRSGASLAAIPNLTWKERGEVRVNPHTFVPPSLDYVDLRPDLVADMVLRHRDLTSTLPLQKWWRNPISAVLTVKGCSHDCVTCGASRTTCTHLIKRSGPVFRSPASLVANMVAISRLSRAPIYLVGDVLQAGPDAAHEILERLQHAKLRNEVVFEFLDLPPVEFLGEIDRHVARWSMEMSPDSHDPLLRQIQDGEPPYTNEQMEAVFADALSHHCRRIDLFFMIGLPRQTRESVMQTVDYCERLFQRMDKRLACFISPMGPFIDPGSRGFEAPESFGYRLFAKTLEEHRRLLVQPTWERILNYETQWMSRRELVDATYDAAQRLNDLKGLYGRISRREATKINRRIAAARELRSRLDGGATERDSATVDELAGEINRFSMSTVCDKRELFWPRHIFSLKIAGLVRLAANYATR